MNSMSRPVDHNDCGCKKEKEKDAEVLLKCKTSSSVTVTASREEATRRIATLSLDTSKFRIPCIKFEFSTNLIIDNLGANESVTVNFQLFKLCRGESEPTIIGNQWTLVRTEEITDIITFIVCDCDCDCDCVKDECCNYYVEASFIATAPGESPVSPTLAFNNSTLSALVVEKNIRCS